ncbi:immunoglobulin superfamily member [Rhincodon typus]|uniref:immunoglobulin superfamily member n=1 Tax=Rhincodon typus TaxID=259920 RepID=UPI00202FBFC5|nr:immunoglobulin superfamily member [Rhincodon typus]
MVASGATSAFIQLETRLGETMANQSGDAIITTSLPLKAVAIVTLLPFGNGFVSANTIESVGTKTTEATVAGGAFAQPEQPSVNQGIAKLKAEKGKSVVLPCWYLSDGTSLSQVSVLWYKEDTSEKFNLVRDNTTASGDYSGRVFLSGHLSSGDASLTILNVTERDDGTYFCTVILNNGTTLSGDGTHLMVKSRAGLFGLKESLGSTIAIVAASTGVFIGLMVSFVPNLRKKMSCQKLEQAQVAPA